MLYLYLLRYCFRSFKKLIKALRYSFKFILRVLDVLERIRKKRENQKRIRKKEFLKINEGR